MTTSTEVDLLYLLAVFYYFVTLKWTFRTNLQWPATVLPLLSLVVRRLLPRLSYSLLFFPAWISSCADKIKLISAQRNGLMQWPKSDVALGENWGGVANDA